MSTTVSLTKFAGMTNDEHDPSVSACMLSKGFDIHTRPNRLSPRRSSENGYAFQDLVRMVNFLYANNRLYGLGTLNSGTPSTFIQYTSTIDVPSWTSTANNSAAGAPDQNLFSYYRGYIYGASSGSRLWQYDVTGATSFTSTWQSLSYSSIGQGLVHSQDDILYIPYDNKIAAWDGSSFNATAIVLPDIYTVASISEYGNYLAIACKPASGYGNSRMFLWDRDQSLSTLSESIDWGEGSLAVCEEIQGALVGVSISNVVAVAPKLILKVYTSQGAQTFLELPVTTTSFIYTKQKVDGGLFFLADLTINGERHTGAWSVTGNTTSGFSFVHEYLPDNDTDLDLGTGLLHGFNIVGGFAYIAYETNGVFYLSKTDDQTNFDSTSVRVTTANQGMPAADRPRIKKLQAVSLSYIPLPSNASATLEYCVDGGDWIAIFAETTDGVPSTEMTVDASGTAFADGRNYQFRVKSNGGAEITGLQYRYKPLETNL